MMGQKQALLILIQGFSIKVPSKVNLTVAQFESLVNIMVDDIRVGNVSYGKDKNDSYEVRKYVRSMIKNHLNKAPELNGGVRKSSAGGAVFRITQKQATGPALDKSVLPKGLLDAYYDVTGESDGADQ